MFVVLIAPVAAHPDPYLGQKMYDIESRITNVSIADDQNFFGSANVLFRSFVTGLDPSHGEEETMTEDAVSISSGESKAVGPINIYKHKQCGCQKTLKFQIFALDHSPNQSLLKKLLGKLAGYGLSGALGGASGIGANIVADVFQELIDLLTQLGMSASELQAQLRASLQKQSDMLGSALKTETLDCLAGEQSFTAPLELEGTPNGTVTYEVTQTETGEVCDEAENESGAVPPSEEDEPGSAGQPTQPATPPETKPACIPSTGKVLVKDKYYCPTSSVETAGGVCECIEDYEWVDPANLCLGCTKTRKDKCYAAIKLAIDMGTGYTEPDLSYSGDDKIVWQLGEISCKHLQSVITDYSSGVRQALTTTNKECTNARLDSTPTAQTGCSFQMIFKYK
jgi:hypothetical protein